MMRPRLLSLSLLCAIVAAVPSLPAQDSAGGTNASSPFERLRFRNIGPATMGGRIDDFAVLERNPNAVAYSGVVYVRERLEEGARIELDRSTPFLHSQFDREKLFVQNYIPVNTWVHPRAMLATVGEFDTGLTAFEDWDMLLRLAARYPVVHMPEITAEVRVREGAGASGEGIVRRDAVG